MPSEKVSRRGGGAGATAGARDDEDKDDVDDDEAEESESEPESSTTYFSLRFCCCEPVGGAGVIGFFRRFLTAGLVGLALEGSIARGDASAM